MLQKSLACVLSAFLFLGQSGLADLHGSPRGNAVASAGPAVLSASGFLIPPDIGRIRENALSDQPGPAREVIIQIQDSHCLYEAQKNIGRIIDFLHRRYGLDLVTVEGAAAGPVNLSLFGAFPEKRIRDRVVDDFVLQGIISGPEQAAIRDYGRQGAPSLYGTENVALYYENLIAFRDVHVLLGEAEAGLAEIFSVSSSLKKKIFPEALFVFDERAEAFRKGELSLAEYVPILMQTYRSKVGKQTAQIGNLELFIHAKDMEDSLNTDAVETEKNVLFSRIETALPEEDLVVFVRQSLLFRLGKITPWEYYSSLVKTAGAVFGGDFSLARDYPSLNRYIQIINEHAQLDVEGLIAEIALLESVIKESLFRGSDDRHLDEVLGNVLLLNDLVHLQWTRDSLEDWENGSTSFSEIHRSLARLSSKYLTDGLQLKQEEIEILQLCVSKALEFYRLAMLRDRELLENALNAMRSKNQRYAVLVSGGFHSAGIVELIKEKGLDYAVVTPRITAIEAENPYMALMTDTRFNPVFPNVRNTAIAYPSYTLIELLDKALAKEIEISSITSLLAATIDGGQAETDRVFARWRQELPEKYRPLLDEVMQQLRGSVFGGPGRRLTCSQ